MNTVQIERKELLRILKENKEKHVQEYNEAIVERNIVVVEQMRELIVQFESGEKDLEHITFPLPKSQEKEYNKAIRMVELDVRDSIELSEHDFEQWVLDEWGWKHVFASTASLYNNKMSV